MAWNFGKSGQRNSPISHFIFWWLVFRYLAGPWYPRPRHLYNFPIMWFGLFEWIHLPFTPDPTTAGNFADTHAILAWATIILLGMHVGAALKHHFINRDDVCWPAWSYALKNAQSNEDKHEKTISLLSAVTALLLSSTASFAATNWDVIEKSSRLNFIASQSGKDIKGELRHSRRPSLLTKMICRALTSRWL